MGHKFTFNIFFICYKVLATAVILREKITDRYFHLYSIICITQREWAAWEAMFMVR